MSLQYIVLNERKIIALPAVLEALIKAHEDLVAQNISYEGLFGFVLSTEKAGSWRSLTLQKELVAKGSSKTLYSNHRRGTAVDCAADWDYINRIKSTMNKYGLFNDLAYAKYQGSKIVATADAKKTGYVAWDGGHWNWQSNSKAESYPIIDKLSGELQKYMDATYENTVIWLAEKDLPQSGSFAAVYGSKKHLIAVSRHGTAALHPLFSGKKTAPVDGKTWDSIETGDAF